MRPTLILATAAALLHVTAVHAGDTVEPGAASGSSYTYIDATHFAIEGDGRATALRGSVELGDSGFYATAGEYAVRADDGRSRITSFGAGYHHALSDDTDLVVEAALDRHRWDGGGARQASAAVGTYHAFSDAFEVSVLLTRYFADDGFPATTTVYLGGQRMLTANVALVVDSEFGADPAWYGVGLRYFIH